MLGPPASGVATGGGRTCCKVTPLPGAPSRTARIAWIVVAVLVVFPVWAAAARAASGLDLCLVVLKPEPT